MDGNQLQSLAKTKSPRMPHNTAKHSKSKTASKGKKTHIKSALSMNQKLELRTKKVSLSILL